MEENQTGFWLKKKKLKFSSRPILVPDSKVVAHSFRYLEGNFGIQANCSHINRYW